MPAYVRRWRGGAGRGEVRAVTGLVAWLAWLIWLAWLVWLAWLTWRAWLAWLAWWMEEVVEHIVGGIVEGMLGEIGEIARRKCQAKARTSWFAHLALVV